jgi:hypothetical protein
LHDPLLFTSGSLFTLDYLVEAIAETEEYRSVDATELRRRLERVAEAFPRAHRPNESQTEDDFIWPVLGALGWSESLRQQNLTVTGREDVPDGLLFANAEAKAAANAEAEEWKRYGHGLAAVESKRWSRPLDRASGRDEATAPSTQMLRYLRRIDDLTHGRLRWGILTNGAKWRLYWAGARSVSEEFLEIDLGRVLGLSDGDDLFASETDCDHWLRVFAVMFARTSFVREGPERRSFHERARAAAAFYEERVAASLSGLVFGRVFPSLASAIAAAAPQAPLEQVREAAFVLLYRLLFLLYAEDRSLLPVNDRRYDDYALRPLREEVAARISEGDTFSSSAAPIWNRITDLSRIIDRGDAPVGIPPYNGGLFAADAAGGLLDAIRISDAVMAPALDRLSHERSGGQARYINYRDLSVQQLGSIYERLLEFELVRDEAGALAVRPNLFARKNTGSYYTPDELVGLILDETLEPLIAERLEAFRTSLSDLSQRDSEDYRRRLLREADPANSILGLRICDPAMGSGHFLVSLVDTLADHVLDAMAEAAVLATDLDYVSPLAEKIEDIRATILRNARANGWAIDEAHLDDRHIVRRMVLKRCVYGVDKNPMAVELAKVALWLHTFTVGAPLSFIDHHLRAGDSLFGLWVRDAIDKASALGGELLWNEALQNAQRQAQAMKTIEMATDAEIAEAHRSAEMWTDVEFQTGPLDSFVSFMHALDWLNLSRAEKGLVRLWLDGQFGDPLPISRGKTRPEPIRAKPEEAEAFAGIWERSRALIAEERFLNWQIAFPGVWDNWASAERRGGFDAVVGNPPWDRIKLQQVEWFAARRPEIARAERASERKNMIAALKAASDPLYSDFEKADARAADSARMARTSGEYPMLSRGDVNLYSLFVERAQGLVKPDGMVGLLTPVGIGTDKGASAFFSNITAGEKLRSFISFENKRRWLFKDVHAEDQPTVIIFSGGSRRFNRFSYAVKLHSMIELEDPRLVRLDADILRRINPNTTTAPIARNSRDLALVAAAYDRLPVLADRSSGTLELTWPVRYVTKFHMTNDSALFRTRSEIEELEGGWKASDGRFDSPAGLWLPLYEGKSIQIYNHRFASVVTPEGSVSGQGKAIHATNSQLADPTFLPTPRFYVLDAHVNTISCGYTIGFNDICNTNNSRSVIAAAIPRVASGNKLPLLEGLEAHHLCLLLGNLNAIPLDFIARSKIQSRNLNKYILEQLPVIPLSGYARTFGANSAADVVQRAVLELTYTAHDMEPFARDMGYVDEAGEVRPPFRWDEDRRLKLRAKLDALYFILYGVYDPAEPERSRDDVSYIYSTFPIVEREEQAKYGRYRSRDLCLAWINALIAGRPDANVEG